MIRSLALCLTLCAPALAVAEGDAQPQMTAAAAKLAEARLATQAAAGADNPIASLTQAIRAYEDGLIAVRSGWGSTAARATQLRAQFDRQKPEMARLLSALMTLPQGTTPAARLHPNGATASLRAELLAADIAPALQADVTRLRAEMAALATAETARDKAQTLLDQGVAGLTAARADLWQALEDRPPLPTRFTNDPVQTAVLSANATTVAELAATLIKLHPGGLPNDAMLAAKGTLPLPVTGRLLAPFNAATGKETTSNGVIIATPPQALVVSPTAATILYQGPFLTFDHVVIIEPSAGLMLVFAGLNTVYGSPGQIIPAGTPLGTMGGETPLTDMNLTTFPVTKSGGASQALYIEVRDGQTPVDPATWFALEQQVEEK